MKNRKIHVRTSQSRSAFNRSADFEGIIFRDQCVSPTAVSNSTPPAWRISDVTSFGLANSTSDTKIYTEISVEYPGRAIVVTKDKGTELVRNARSSAGSVCTIIFGSSIKSAHDQELALKALFRRKGFRDYRRLPQWYSIIRLSRWGSYLNIEYTDLRRNKKILSSTIRIPIWT